MRFNDSMLRQLLMMGCLLLTSCTTTTPPSHFYLLANLVETGGISVPNEQAKPSWGLVVGPVSLPEYLDRPQIVTRLTFHELKLDELHRWGSALDDQLQRLVADNLSQLLANQQVIPYTVAEKHGLDYQLFLDVLQLEGQLGQAAVLKVHWSLLDRQQREILLSETVQIQNPLTDVSYAAFVTGQSRAFAQLSRIIAERLQHTLE